MDVLLAFGCDTLSLDIRCTVYWLPAHVSVVLHQKACLALCLNQDLKVGLSTSSAPQAIMARVRRRN